MSKCKWVARKNKTKQNKTCWADSLLCWGAQLCCRTFSKQVKWSKIVTRMRMLALRQEPLMQALILHVSGSVVLS